MVGALIRAQVRRVGTVLLLGPLIAGLLVGGVSLLVSSALPSVQVMTLVNWLSQIFVICAGLCVAVALTGDPLIELHESTPTQFRQIQMLRATLVTVSALLGALVMFTSSHLLRVWPRDVGWISLVAPAGAAIILAVVAIMSAAFSGTISATTMAVVTAWMFLAMLWDPYVVPLTAQRGLPLVASVILLFLAWRRMGDNERNIAKVATI